MKYTTLLQRWFDVAPRRDVVSTRRQRWNNVGDRITIWLIDDVTLVSVCLHDDLILAFLLQQFETRNRWIRTRMDYPLALQANRLKCFPTQVLSCEVCETFKSTYLKNILKRQLLEVFIKKLLLKTFHYSLRESS